MMQKANLTTLTDEVLINKIYVIREQKVMLDRDLAELYGVETNEVFSTFGFWLFVYCGFLSRIDTYFPLTYLPF